MRTLPPTGTASSGCQSTTLREPVRRHALGDAGDLHGSAQYHGRQCLDPAHSPQSASTNEEATWVVTPFLVPNPIALPISVWLANHMRRKKPAAELCCGLHGDVAVLWSGHFTYAAVYSSRTARAYRRRAAAAGPGDSSGSFLQGIRSWCSISRGSTCLRGSGTSAGRRFYEESH
jgi:hypothetical protein